jgi:hypothetical protein
VQFVVSTEPDYPKGGGIELIEVRKADGKLDVQTFKELKVSLKSLSASLTFEVDSGDGFPGPDGK